MTHTPPPPPSSSPAPPQSARAAPPPAAAPAASAPTRAATRRRARPRVRAVACGVRWVWRMRWVRRVRWWCCCCCPGVARSPPLHTTPAPCAPAPPPPPLSSRHRATELSRSCSLAAGCRLSAGGPACAARRRRGGARDLWVRDAGDWGDLPAARGWAVRAWQLGSQRGEPAGQGGGHRGACHGRGGGARGSCAVPRGVGGWVEDGGGGDRPARASLSRFRCPRSLPLPPPPRCRTFFPSALVRWRGTARCCWATRACPPAWTCGTPPLFPLPPTPTTTTSACEGWGWTASSSPWTR